MKNHSIIKPNNDLIGLAEEAKLLRNDYVRQSIMAASLSDDNTLENHLSKFLGYKAAYEKLLQYPFEQHLENPVSSESDGDKKIILGIIQRINVPFIYLVKMLVMHMLILGSSGVGKTNLIMGILAQCIRHGVKIFAIDREKFDYRRLLRFTPDIKIFSALKNFYFNPLQVPENVDPKLWCSKFSEVFSKANGFLQGSGNLLLDIMIDLFKRYGIFAGSKNFPTFIDLRKAIYNFKLGRQNYRQLQFLDSMKNRLNAYIALFGDVFQYSHGIPIGWIASNNIVSEIKGVPEDMARFSSAIILYALMEYRQASNLHYDELENLICVDEAKWYSVPQPESSPGGASLLSYLISTVRSSGIGMIIGDQTSRLDDSTFSNTTTKVCFRLGDGKDVERAAKSMSLTEEQARFVTKLGTAECIVRIPEEEPFVINTLKVNF